MKINLHDAQGFVVRTSTGFHAIATVHPVAVCILVGIICAWIGHAL